MIWPRALQKVKKSRGSGADCPNIRADSLSGWVLCFVTTSSEEREAAVFVENKKKPDHTHSGPVQIPLLKVIRIWSSKAFGLRITIV